MNLYGLIFLAVSSVTISDKTMKDELFPMDNSHVLFIDKQGITRKGIYKKDLNGYIESDGAELPEDPEYIYPEDEIVKWEYPEKRNPDADFMVIL